MSEVLGHDIDGRPLKVGDEVVVVNPKVRAWVNHKGRTFTIRGIDPDNGWMVTVVELPPPFATNPARLRKRHSDHRPADESYKELMSILKTGNVQVTT